MRKLTLLAALVLLTWPMAIASANDEDDDDDDMFLRELDMRVTDLEERVTDLENTPDKDTLGELSCSGGEIAKFDGTAWVCAADEVGRDTLGELSCADGEIARFDGATSEWVCSEESGGGELLRTVVVSPVGPTAVDNCDLLLAALDGITDNGPDNAYLVKLEPGVYDCGLDSVMMKPYVDIEGSGRDTTRITGAGNSFDLTTGATAGVVAGAENSELRGLTVEHRGEPQVRFAFAVTNQAKDMRVTDVRARVLAPATDLSAGMVMGDIEGIAYIEDVRVDTPPGASVGIYLVPISGLSGGDLLINNATVDSGTALAVVGGGVIIRNSLLFANFSAALSSDSRTRVISTGLFGNATGSDFACVGAYDANYQPLDGNCGASSFAATTAETSPTNPFALSP